MQRLLAVLSLLCSLQLVYVSSQRLIVSEKGVAVFSFLSPKSLERNYLQWPTESISWLLLHFDKILLNPIHMSDTEWAYRSSRIVHNKLICVDFTDVVLMASSCLLARTPLGTWAVEKTAPGARQEVMAKESSSPLPLWRAESDELSLCSSNRNVFVPLSTMFQSRPVFPLSCCVQCMYIRWQVWIIKCLC